MARTVTDELVTVLGYKVEGKQQAKQYKRDLGDIKGGISRFADAVVGFGLAISAGLSVLIGGSITRATIRTNAELEQMMQTLITIEGSSEKAKESFKWITKFSDDVPLSIQDIKQAFIQLKSFGIDPIANDTLRILGDASSAMEVPFTDSIDAFNNATTGIFQNLKRFGLNIRDEGDKLNIMWGEHGQQLKKVIKDDSESIQRFLLENFERRFGGALTRQANTWFGLMTKLTNRWTLFLASIGKAGVFEVAKNKISELLAILRVWDKDGSLDFWAKKISDIESAAIEKLSFIIKNMGFNIKFLYQNSEALMPLLKAMAVIGAILVVVYAPISATILAIVLILDSLIVMMQGGDSVIGRFIKSFEGLSDIFKSIKKRFKGVIDSIKKLVESTEFDKLLHVIGRTLTWLLLLVVDFALTMVENLLYIIKHWQKFKPLFILIGVAIAAFVLAFSPLITILGVTIFIFNDLMSLFIHGKGYIWDLISSLDTLTGWLNLLKIALIGIGIILGAVIFKFGTSLIAWGIGFLVFKKLAAIFPALRTLQLLFLGLGAHIRVFLLAMSLSFVPFVTAGHIALHIFIMALGYLGAKFKKLKAILFPIVLMFKNFLKVIGLLLLRIFSFAGLKFLFLRLFALLLGPIGWILTALALIGPTLYDSIMKHDGDIRSWFLSLFSDEFKNDMNELLNWSSKFYNSLLLFTDPIAQWFNDLIPDWLKNLFVGFGSNLLKAAGLALPGSTLGDNNLQMEGFGSNLSKAFGLTLPGSTLGSHLTVQSNVTQNIGQLSEAADLAAEATVTAVEGATVASAARFSREPQMVP